MRLIHSECGGILTIDWASPRELVDNGRTTDIYTPVKCAGCNAKLGMLPNVDEAYYFKPSENGRSYAAN